jgi:hypothetical protein
MWPRGRSEGGRPRSVARKRSLGHPRVGRPLRRVRRPGRAGAASDGCEPRRRAGRRPGTCPGITRGGSATLRLDHGRSRRLNRVAIDEKGPEGDGGVIVEGRRSWWPCVRWLPQSTHGRASVCGTFGASIRRLWNRRRPFIGAPAFGIPPAEASRDDRSDGPHARLPADIFRLPSSWVHWGEIAESAGSRPALHDFSLCSDEEDEGPPAHGQESGASTAWTLSSYRSGWKVAWRSRVATRGTSLRRDREIAVQASNAASEPAIDESQSEVGFAIAGRGGNHGRADQ